MDTTIDKEKLECMKYAELRKVAKTVGIKANMKADKLLKALIEYAATQQKDVGIVRSETPKSQSAKGTSAKKTEVETSKKTPSGRENTPVLKNVRSSLCQNRTPLSAQRRMLTPSSAKARTPLQRLRTPPSRKSSPSINKPVAGGSSSRNVTGKSSREGRGASLKRKPSSEDVESPAPKNKRARTNTYELDESEVQSPKPVASPGTKQIIDSMGEDMSEGLMKEKIMEALNKKVQNKMDTQPTHIPRFVAFAQMKKEQAAANLTPGQQRWEKIHAKQFEKMESIDAYLEKKKKRTEVVTGSAQKAKVLAEQTSSVLKKMKKINTPLASKPTDSSKTCLFKTPGHDGVPFIPKVTSVSKVNFNFSTSTKTPGQQSNTTRKSPRLQTIESKENATAEKVSKVNSNTPAQRKSMGVVKDAGKIKGTTPFKFNAALNKSLGHNTSMNKSINKPKFNLAASLARPMTWKPHTGKLKPVMTDRPASLRKDVKEVKVTTKEERRHKMKAAQSSKRHATQMNRRGIQA